VFCLEFGFEAGFQGGLNVDKEAETLDLLAELARNSFGTLGEFAQELIFFLCESIKVLSEEIREVLSLSSFIEFREY
jgi:hypothetical protein